MFIKKNDLDEKIKTDNALSKALTVDELMDALIELAGMISDQDDALVELADVLSNEEEK